METISYKVELPDPYENAYERVTMEFEHRMRSREMEGIEAALKEHGYVKERICKNVSVTKRLFDCSACSYYYPDLQDFRYCPECGAKVV